MFKYLAVLLVVAIIGLATGRAMALPVPSLELIRQTASTVTLAASSANRLTNLKVIQGNRPHHKRRYIRKRHHLGHWNNHRNFYPYYRRARPYYGPGYFGWGYCGWGYGTLPYDCLRGNYYGDVHDDAPVKKLRVSGSKHVTWCKARYKTYDVKTDTFIGKGKKKYRCNSPYDGSR